jgi:hypothetical protein
MKLTSLLLGGFLLTQTACGASPMLNHTSPNRAVETGAITTGNDDDSGCDLYFKSQNLCATLGWVKEPTRDEEGSFKLFFFNHDQGLAQRPIGVDPDGTVFVKLWMPEMGHGSQKVVTSHSKNDQGDEVEGEYDSTEVYFVMSGKWEVIVQLKDAAGKVTDSAKVNYNAL